MAIIHNINPTLLDLGPVEIRYYGLVYVIGFVVVYFYFDWLIKHKKIKLSKEELYDLVFYNMVGVLVGSRLVHCLIWEPSYYLPQPWKILYFWEGGMAFHGGLIGVAIAMYLFWLKIDKRVSLLRLGDYAAIPAAFMLAVGRIANFINGELPGRVTDVSWCIDYTKSMYLVNPPEGCRHPQVLYAAVKRFLVFGWLVWLNRRKYADGFIMWNMILWFGVGRIIIDFYRDDPVYLIFTTGQWMSLVMALLGGYMLLSRYRKDLKKVFS